jgi:hypothetical protein
VSQPKRPQCHSCAAPLCTRTPTAARSRPQPGRFIRIYGTQYYVTGGGGGGHQRQQLIAETGSSFSQAQTRGYACDENRIFSSSHRPVSVVRFSEQRQHVKPSISREGLPILISAAVAAGWLLDSAILALNLTMRCDFIDYRPGAAATLFQGYSTKSF